MNEYTFFELQVGHTEQFEVTITPQMEESFRTLSGDINPLHQDDAFAQEVGQGRFVSHVTFGMLTASFYSTLAGVYLPGRYSLIHSLDLQFPKPVYVGDTLTIQGEVTEKVEDLNLILVKAKIKNQHGKIVSRGDFKIIVLK